MDTMRAGSEAGAARILVATDNSDDAQLIRKLLSDEFGNVAVSGDPDKAVEDFGKHQPEVLLLAFETLEKSERYYLGLYRLGAAVQAVPHRTVILCNKDDVRQVYQLCRKEYFDDYVLFWPMSHDATRLLLAVHHALRHNAAAATGRPSAGEIAAQVRRLDGLDAALEGHAALGRQHAEAIGQSLEQASQGMGATLDRFAQWLATASGQGQAGAGEREMIARELQRLKTDDVARHLRRVAATLQPVQRWAGNLQHDIAPQVQAVRALKATAERVQRLVLIVDDDEFQRKLLERMLGSAGFETISAASAVEALAAVARRRPDLVLMDVELPDFDGVQATSRIKAVEGQAGIPVLMITGHSNKDVIFSSVMAGSAGFLVKPFDKTVLLEKVSRCLEEAAGLAAAA